jgi:hypothetical protein
MLKRTALLLVLVSGLAWGAGRRPGAVFLMIWPGSRPTALGGSFTAIADDASAAYYNPAGLGFQQGINLSLMHVNWLPELSPDMYYEYLAVGAPFKGIGTFAFNGIYLTTGKMQAQYPDGSLLAEYTPFDLAFTLSYGRELTPKVAVGGGTKIIYSLLVPDWILERLGISGSGSALSWAVDAGVFYKPIKNLQLGAALQNLGPPISFSSDAEKDPLPLMLRLGASYKPLSIISPDTTKERFEIVGLRITGDLTKVMVGMFPYDTPEADSIPFFQELGYELEDTWRGLGLELSVFKEILTLRAGYFFDKNGARGGFLVENETGSQEHLGLFPFLFGSSEGKLKRVGVTFGGGIKYKGFQLDVGIDEMIYDFETANRKFSLSYTF